MRGTKTALALFMATSIAICTPAVAQTVTDIDLDSAPPDQTVLDDATSTVETAPEVEQAPTDTSATSPFAERFNSLAAAMVGFYAGEAGLSVADYLGTHSTQVAGLLNLPELALELPTIGSFAEFDLRLRSSGATLDVAGIASFDDLLAEVQAKASSLDGHVTLLGASYASNLANLRTPELTLPGLPALSGAGPESLAFGLFVNESLIGLVSQHPDVFAQVRQTGLGTTESLAAWRSSMLQAGTVVGNDLSRLPMPCIGEMLQAMASGSAVSSGAGCGTCAVAGAYLHNQTLDLLNPDTNTTLGAAPGSVPGSLQSWLTDALVEDNPSLAAELDEVLEPSNALGGCSVASGATSSALGALLPDVFANLAEGPTTPPTLPGGFADLLPTQPVTSTVSTPSTTLPAAPPTSPPALPGGFATLVPSDD